MSDLLIGKRPVGTIGYIGGGAMVFEQFSWSMIQLVAMSHEYFLAPDTYVHLDRAIGSGQATGRNELVAKMQGEWLLQLDTDHDFEPDLAFRLLQPFENCHLDVLVGYYGYKQEPHNPVLYKYMDGKYRNILDWGGSEVKLLPIDAAGGGCLLVRASVFKRMREHFGVMPFDPCPPFHTDDFSFFERCRLLGIKCWAAPNIECKHLAVKGYGLSDFRREFAPAGSVSEVQAVVA